MALPVSFNKVNVRGKFVDLAGDAVQGSVSFTPTAAVMQAATEVTTVVGKTLTVPLIAGVLDVDLPATDDPDIDPTGFTYTVVEDFKGLKGRTYSITVPIAMAGSGIELATAAPAVPTVGLVRPYTLDELGDVVAAGVTGDALIRQADGTWAAGAVLTQATASGTYLTVIAHGATAGATRTAGAARVLWVGSVNPSTATTNDLLVRTDSSSLFLYDGASWDALGGGGGGGGSTVTLDADGTLVVDGLTVEVATDAALAAHEADTTGIHGIADTAALVTSTTVDVVWTGTQAAYNALTPNATTLYIVTD